MLVAGDLLAACLAYLLAFTLRVRRAVPAHAGLPAAAPLRGGEPPLAEMLLAQLAMLYFLGLYETRAVSASPRPRSAPVVAAAGCRRWS